MVESHNKKLVVDEFTTPSPVTVAPETSIEEVFRLMEEQGIRHVPVVRGTEPIGMISDRDIKVLGRFPTWPTFVAEDVMSPDPYVVSPETNIDEVAYNMSERKIGSAIVQNESGEIVGIFTSTDALNALVEVIRGDI